MSRKAFTRKRFGHTTFALAALIAGSLSSASAAGIVVNSLADGSVSGSCTLRDAVQAASTGAVVNGCLGVPGANTITFSVSGTITLTSILDLGTPAAPYTIDGSGQSIAISGNDTVTIMAASHSPSAITLKNLMLTHGYGPFDGGAINLTSSTMNILNCTFAANKGNSGGAIYTILSTLAISGSTFVGNSAFNDGGGAIFSGGTTTISNSTFNGNSSAPSPNTSDAGGGAISNFGTLTLLNDTFWGNGAVTGGGTLENAGPLTIANTILAGSTSGPNCASAPSPYPPGTITATGPNIVADGSCSIAGAIAADPQLAALADNGGPTETMALAAGSPAVGAGNDTVCTAAPVNNVDQRGQLRPSGTCDIGAYQSNFHFFTFTGFFAPVANLPAENGVKAGSAVPMQFSLGGDQGLAILAAGYPQAQPVNCASGDPADLPVQTVNPGSSTLSFDPVTNLYTYVWKTQKGWAGTCQQFIMRLTDGTYHMALFRMK